MCTRGTARARAARASARRQIAAVRANMRCFQNATHAIRGVSMRHVIGCAAAAALVVTMLAANAQQARQPGTAEFRDRRPASSCRRSVQGRSSTRRPEARHTRRRAHARSRSSVEPRVAAERRDARDRTRRASCASSATACSIRSRSTGVPEVRVQGLSGLFDVVLHPQFATQSRRLFELQQSRIGRAPERARCRARRLERPGAHGRARHLRHDGREQRLAARVRPRRQALRQHVRQRR